MPETFGKITKGLTEAWTAANWINACKFQSGSAGSLQSITIYVKEKDAGAHIKCAIYDSSFNLLTNGITEEKIIPSGQDGWLTFSFATPPEIAASTNYWLTFWWDASVYWYHDAGEANQRLYDAVTYNSWPATLSPDGYSAYEISIYATYTEPNQAPTAPSSLLCEGEAAPSNVTDLTPEFSAIYEDPDSGDIANAVEIHVATTEGGLGSPDMWDSGWIDISAESLVEGNRCNDQSYAGSALSLDGSTYYWKIRFRDDDNAEGAWSSVAQFTMGTPAPPVAVGGLLSQIW